MPTKAEYTSVENLPRVLTPILEFPLSEIRNGKKKELEHLMGVYFIQNTKTKRLYIGSTNSFGKRLDAHIRCLRNGDHGNSKLQRCYNKYGEDVFVCGIVEVVYSEDMLYEREGIFTDLYEATDRHKGYVLKAAYKGQARFSEEAKEKMGVKHRVKIVRISCDPNQPSITVFSSFKEALKAGGTHVYSVLTGKTRFTNRKKYTWLHFDRFIEIPKVSDYVKALVNAHNNVKDTSVRACNCDILNVETGIYYQSKRQAYDSIVTDTDYQTFCYLLDKERLPQFVTFRNGKPKRYQVRNTLTGEVYKSIEAASKVLGFAPYWLKEKIQRGELPTYEVVEVERVKKEKTKRPKKPIDWMSSVLVRQKPVTVYQVGVSYYFASIAKCANYFGIERSLLHRAFKTNGKYKDILIKYA